MSDGKTEIKTQIESGERTKRTLILWVTWLLRIAVGGTFVFSGFIKGVDPWGTLYKFQEYIAALGWHTLPSLIITGVFTLCASEFMIGITILLGCYRRSSPVLALILMCVMLPLTLWIAISNPVSDCGCFGDYLVLSNWATFWKNVALTAMTIWLVKFNRTATGIISPAFQWIGAVISALFIIVVSLLGYFVQPLLDFRPYPAGTALVSESVDESSDEGNRFTYVYRKDGREKEFAIDDELPSEDDGWEFVERRSSARVISVEPETKGDKTFRIWNLSGDTDVTDNLMESDGNMLLLLIPDLPGVSPATTWKINELYEWANRQGINMTAVVSGTISEITEWEDLSMPDYPIYTSDDTAIKEVARGNPAIVLVENGKIVWKTTLNALDADKLNEPDGKFTPHEVIADGVKVMHNLLYIYMMCMCIPIAMSFMPRIRHAYMSRKHVKATRDDKAHCEE